MSKKITIFLVVLCALFAVFLFRDVLVKTYHDTAQRLQNFQKNELGDIVSEIKKEILSPNPLNIGGKANNAVLTGAKVILETNIQRYQHGKLPALAENARLNAAAKAKAEDMFKNQYFEHISPNGVDPGELVRRAGYEYIVTGENLILGNFKDEQEVVQHWMNSPGHRANILNTRFTDIGVAIIKGEYKGQIIWLGVQEFGLPLDACSQPGIQLKANIDANKNTLDQLALQIEAKRQEIEVTSRRSERYNQLVDEYNALVSQYNTLNQRTKGLINQYNAQVNAFNQCIAGSS